MFHFSLCMELGSCPDAHTKTAREAKRRAGGSTSRKTGERCLDPFASEPDTFLFLPFAPCHILSLCPLAWCAMPPTPKLLVPSFLPLFSFGPDHSPPVGTTPPLSLAPRAPFTAPLPCDLTVLHTHTAPLQTNTMNTNMALCPWHLGRRGGGC